MQAILTKQVHVLTLFFALMFLVVNVAEASDNYKEIEWIELMPADDLQALLNPPKFLADIEDGSSNDSVEALGNLGESDEAFESRLEIIADSKQALQNAVEAIEKMQSMGKT